ncbi:MAG: hypothetical protein ACTSRG_26435, partial [Candidatus Helarchaeota archaeon]
MSKLYKITSNGEISEIDKAHFSNEIIDLENFIIKNEEILGNVILIERQITISSSKRIDLWGIDYLEVKPVIVELKNVLTGLEIISQIIPYYNFVKLNLDTLKYKATTNKKFNQKLKRIGIEEEKIINNLQDEPKVIIIAPKFKKELLDAINYINFQIEPIELTRYKKNNEIFVSINRPEIPTPPSPVRVQEEWDWDKYEKIGISKQKNELAKKLKQSLDEIMETEQIGLHPVFRKLYIPYQNGRNNVVILDLEYTSRTTGDVRLTLKLPEEPNL